MAALNQQRYALAESDARACIALDPDNSEFLAQPILGASLAAQGRTDEAMKVYGQLYAGDIAWPGDMLAYALLLLNKGGWTKALDQRVQQQRRPLN